MLAYNRSGSGILSGVHSKLCKYSVVRVDNCVAFPTLSARGDRHLTASTKCLARCYRCTLATVAPNQNFQIDGVTPGWLFALPSIHLGLFSQQQVVLLGYVRGFATILEPVPQ